MPTKNSEESPDYTVASLREVAEFFGVSANTVRQSWRGNGMPGPTPSGRWDISAIAKWQLARLEIQALRRRARLRDGETI